MRIKLLIISFQLTTTMRLNVFILFLQYFILSTATTGNIKLPYPTAIMYHLMTLSEANNLVQFSRIQSARSCESMFLLQHQLSVYAQALPQLEIAAYVISYAFVYDRAFHVVQLLSKQGPLDYVDFHHVEKCKQNLLSKLFINPMERESMAIFLREAQIVNKIFGSAFAKFSKPKQDRELCQELYKTLNPYGGGTAQSELSTAYALLHPLEMQAYIQNVKAEENPAYTLITYCGRIYFGHAIIQVNIRREEMREEMRPYKRQRTETDRPGSILLKPVFRDSSSGRLNSINANEVNNLSDGSAIDALLQDVLENPLDDVSLTELGTLNDFQNIFKNDRK